VSCPTCGANAGKRCELNTGRPRFVRIRVYVTDGRLTNTQIAAIVTKYAKNHPDEWKADANMVAYQARFECRVTGFSGAPDFQGHS
jgi:hypothetical protein